MQLTAKSYLPGRRVSIFLLKIPASVRELLSLLTKNGFQAFVVGGCVRDSLLGGSPNDWDICTSALPSETLQVFTGYKTLTHGLKHGTVTVVSAGRLYEITTFRRETTYSDFRRPDEVQFITDIHQDLLRRDITINAMAYNPMEGLIDDHHGLQDLRARRICCVGNPQTRFQEDALRILRVLRFASTLNFGIEQQTGSAVLACRRLLSHISAERLNNELQKLLTGDGAVKICTEFSAVFSVFIPMTDAMKRGWALCAPLLSHLPKDLTSRLLFMLGGIHDSTLIPDSIGLEKALNELRFEKRQVRELLQLAALMPTDLTASNFQAILAQIGAPQFYRLLTVKESCLHLMPLERQATERQALLILREEAAAFLHNPNACYQLRQLAVSGRDLLSVGVPAGPEIGWTLRQLLALVIAGKRSNTREDLLEALHELKQARR